MTKQDNVKALVELTGSSITQITQGHVKSDWKVYANDTDKVLCAFPSKYSENEIFHIMDFAKEYELKALNAGIKFQRDKQNGALGETIAKQKKLIEALKQENEKLADALDKEISKINTKDKK